MVKTGKIPILIFGATAKKTLEHSREALEKIL